MLQIQPADGMCNMPLEKFEIETFDLAIVLCDRAQQACRD